MKDFVIYTVLVGDYDDIMQPKVIDPRFDYILYSNNYFKNSQIGIWQVRPIDIDLELDIKRLSRYPKTHPETLLADYKASLYIDANVQIMDQWVYDRFCQLFCDNIEYAGIHLVLTGRDCIYDHSFDMCQSLLEHDFVAVRQCNQLYMNGFPAHFGLNENNIIYRKHSERMKNVDEEWWDWIIRCSSRDQFSYMYCLWKYEIPLNYFLPKGEDARNGSHFKLVKHDARPFVLKTKIVNRSLFERLRIKCRRFNTGKSLSTWSKIYKSKHPIALLYYSSIKEIIVNIPRLIKTLVR